MENTEQQIQELIHDWHEQGRAAFESEYHNLDYDSAGYRKSAKEKKKYVYLDDGTSGAFMLDRATGGIYTIKAYGCINRRGFVGNLGKISGATLVQYRWGGTLQRKQ